MKMMNIMNIPYSEKKILADFKITIPKLIEWKRPLSRNQGFFIENGHITKLNLWGLNLSTLPTSIGDLKELRHLELSSNRLKNLPDSLQNLSNLEVLQLSGNFLTSLPDWFGNLKNIRSLNLGANKLNSLPDTIGNLEKLDWFELSGNKISVLPNSFNNLKKLIYLGIEDVELRSFSNIPKEFFEQIDILEDSWQHHLTGNYPSKKGESLFLKDLGLFCSYYKIPPLNLAQKYAHDQDSLTQEEKERLAWEGGYRERHLIEEGVEPDDWILAEINKRLTISCNNGLELIK